MDNYSSLNGFSKQFTSFYEPRTPLVVMNSMGTITNSLPAPWIYGAGTPTLQGDTKRKYVNFPDSSTGVLQRIRISQQPYNYKYTTNGGGGTNTLFIRWNKRSGTTSTFGNLFQLSFALALIPISFNRTFSLVPSYTIPNNTFVNITFVYTNTDTKVYFNGQLLAVTPDSPQQLFDGSLSSASVWLQNPINLDYPNEFDLMYFAHYDSPLSSNDIRLIYNSGLPLMDNSAIGPLQAYPTPLSTINSPTNPIWIWSAYDYLSLTNGAAYNSAGGWVSTLQTALYPPQLVMSVDGSGRRYVNFTSSQECLYKAAVKTSSSFTNQGLSVVAIIRINSIALEPYAGTPFVSTSVATSYIATSSFVLSGQIATLTNSYFATCNGSAGYTIDDAFSVPSTTMGKYFGKFVLYVSTYDGANSRTYVNNTLVGSKSALNKIDSSGDFVNRNTTCVIGVSNSFGFQPPTMGGYTSFDMSYVSVYDRCITQTEMNDIFNSVNSVLDQTDPTQSS